MTVTTGRKVTVRINNDAKERVIVLAETDITYLSEQILLIAIGKAVNSELNQDTEESLQPQQTAAASVNDQHGEDEQEENQERLLARLNYPAR